MNPEEQTAKVKGKLIETQRLLNRQRRGDKLSLEDSKRLVDLVASLNKWGLGDVLVAMPRIKISGLPMY